MLLFAADYADLPLSADLRDLAELKHWQLSGRRAESFLQERWFLQRCTNAALGRAEDEPRPDIDRIAHGKPYFRGLPLFFNLTNSGSALLLLISLEHAVGVDAEVYKPRRTLLKLSRSVLGEAELEHFSALGREGEERGTPEQLEFFLERWTWRECLLKASGIALAGLSGVQGLSGPAQPQRLNAVLSPLNRSGIIYSYALADLEAFPPGVFTLFPGDELKEGRLDCRRYYRQAGRDFGQCLKPLTLAAHRRGLVNPE